MLLLSNLISFTGKMWIFLEVSSFIIRQLIRGLPSFSHNAFFHTTHCLQGCDIFKYQPVRHMHFQVNGLHFDARIRVLFAPGVVILLI